MSSRVGLCAETVSTDRPAGISERTSYVKTSLDCGSSTGEQSVSFSSGSRELRRTHRVKDLAGKGVEQLKPWKRDPRELSEHRRASAERTIELQYDLCAVLHPYEPPDRLLEPSDRLLRLEGRPRLDRAQSRSGRGEAHPRGTRRHRAVALCAAGGRQHASWVVVGGRVRAEGCPKRS